jgi:hypothetical protein
MKHSEDAEQALLFEWASYHPSLRWLFAVPNGGRRDALEARRLKKQGVKSGVSDIFLPIAKGEYHGMFIEMKRRRVDGPSQVSASQRDFQIVMAGSGYKAVVCFGADEAIKEITNYLKM